MSSNLEMITDVLNHYLQDLFNVKNMDCCVVHVCLWVQSMMVAKAKEMLDQEALDIEEEKELYLAEKAPPLQTGGMSLAELQVGLYTSTQQTNGFKQPNPYN